MKKKLKMLVIFLESCASSSYKKSKNEKLG